MTKKVIEYFAARSRLKCPRTSMPRRGAVRREERGVITGLRAGSARDLRP